MSDHDASREAALRRRLGLLKDHLREGKVVFADGLTVTESLSAVRTDSNGEIDLTTVDSSVRALALAVEASQHREDAKGAISLAELQQGYFSTIEQNFGSLYKQMTKEGATPSQVASAVAADREGVRIFGRGIPSFNQWAVELWESASEAIATPKRLHPVAL